MSSTAGTHLGNTPLHLEKLRQVARKELPQILDSVAWWPWCTMLCLTLMHVPLPFSLIHSGPREKESST